MNHITVRPFHICEFSSRFYGIISTKLDRGYCWLKGIQIFSDTDSRLSLDNLLFQNHCGNFNLTLHNYVSFVEVFFKSSTMENSMFVIKKFFYQLYINNLMLIVIAFWLAKDDSLFFLQSVFKHSVYLILLQITLQFSIKQFFRK